jgi:hypothetical protein
MEHRLTCEYGMARVGLQQCWLDGHFRLRLAPRMSDTRAPKFDGGVDGGHGDELERAVKDGCKSGRVYPFFATIWFISMWLMVSGAVNLE